MLVVLQLQVCATHKVVLIQYWVSLLDMFTMWSIHQTYISFKHVFEHTAVFFTFLEPSWVQNQRWKWTISVCYFSFVCIILHPTSVLSLQISTLHSKSCLEYASVLGILNFDKFSKETQAWWLGIMFAFTLYKCILSRLW